MTSVIGSFYALSAQAQNYNYPSNNGNYYGYQAPAKKNTSEFKNFSIGMDYVMGMTTVVDSDFTIDNPLVGGSPYQGKMADFEDSISSLNGNIGWRPFKYFGFEAFYQQSLSDNVTQYQEHYASDPRFAQAEYSVKYKAYGIDALFYLPIASRLELIASAGYANYDFSSEVSFNSYNGTTSDLVKSNNLKMDESTSAVRAGLGAQVKLTERLYVRGMYRYTSIGGEFFDDISEVNLGVRYNF